MYEKAQRTEYFAPQGMVFMTKIDPISKALGKPFAVANAPTVALSFSTDSFTREEDMTGHNYETLKMTNKTTGKLDAEVESTHQKNVEMLFFGKSITVPAGNFVTDIPDSQVEGDFFFLPHPKVSDVVIKDSAATPVKLVRGQHYELDADVGTIEFKDVSAFTQPLNATGQHGEYLPVVMMSELDGEYMMRFQGINKITKERVLVEVYRISLNPTDALNLVSREPGKMKLSGTILADLDKGSDPALGMFGRIVKLGASTLP